MSSLRAPFQLRSGLIIVKCYVHARLCNALTWPCGVPEVGCTDGSDSAQGVNGPVRGEGKSDDAHGL
jgi:hypothetical protein